VSYIEVQELSGTVPKILIADDNAVLRRLLKNVLSHKPEWNVCGEASDGNEALHLALELKPDLVVLDIAMPTMDGLRAASEILKATPEVPIILYTLHKNEQIELEGKKAGVRRVIGKSEDPELLLQCVSELLDGSKSSSEPLSSGSALPLVELKEASNAEASSEAIVQNPAIKPETT
jgi:DNA-binding NarL/FixJ family response regulator